MDYEKKYKEALGKAQEFYNDKDNIWYANAEGMLEEIFPELKESEDECVEKIRKDIISYLNNRQITSIAESSATEKWLTWLEKQGEQKPILSYDALREGIGYFGITQYQIDNWLKKYVVVEKQCEQKSIDKVESKFHKGDLVRLKNGDGLEWIVKEVHSDGYYTIVCADRDDFIYLDDKWELVRKSIDNAEPKFHEGEWITIKE